jgi:hypothetical protein
MCFVLGYVYLAFQSTAQQKMGFCFGDEMKKIYLKNSGKFAIVDDSDYAYLSQFIWREHGTGYAVRTIYRNGKCTISRMHREIIDAIKGRETDHINGNRLDNRKKNLRECTTSQNQANRGAQRNNTSGYKGVRKSTLGKKYEARIQVNRKLLYIGCFETPEIAAMAYDEAARKYFGDFAKTNY